MYYSAIGFLALLILLIENHDILLHRPRSGEAAAQRVYRRFLFAVLVYYITDILWGLLDSRGLHAAIFVDTTVYFIAMAVGVLFWTEYTITYLNTESMAGRFFIYAGRVFCAAVTLIVAVNIFTPVLFWFDESGAYHAGMFRHVILVVQILLLLLLSLYAFNLILQKRDGSITRFRAIELFGVIMAVFLFIQLFFPNLPLCSVAYMLGTCVLHAFVINDEKEAYKEGLEAALERERQYHEALDSALQMVRTDPLTGARSKRACIEAQANTDESIAAGTAPDFAVVVCDLNDLKHINDTQGHEIGDRFLKETWARICAAFPNSPVYRIGGDEFVAILQDEDYVNREALAAAFDREMAENARRGSGIVVTSGCAVFHRRRDQSFHAVFKRADEAMYRRKKELKTQYGPEG